MSLKSGVHVGHYGPPCWGCRDLEVKTIMFVGEDFFCKRFGFLLGRVGRIMEGCIVPREVIKGCYEKKDQNYETKNGELKCVEMNSK